MIRGFVRFSDGSVQPIASVDDLRRAWDDENARFWVDFEEPAEADLGGLRDLMHLDEASVEDCLHGEQRPRIDEFDGYMFIVLYGLVGRDDPSEFDPRKLAALCSTRFLITVHREPLRTVRTVLDRCGRNAVNALGKGVDSILYNIIDGMVDKYVVVADRYEGELERIEDQSLDPAVDEHILADSGNVRRDLLHLRSLATSQRELLTPVAKGEYDYVSDSLEQRFSHVRDHLSQVIDLVDTLRERLNGIRDNYNTALANRTNAIMKTLTIFATIMLPLTLIAGLYGMNLPLWPPPEHPLSFWGVLVAMVAVAAVLLVYFRRKKWL
jgi:magnesium transporter